MGDGQKKEFYAVQDQRFLGGEGFGAEIPRPARKSRSHLSSGDDPDEVLWILSKYLDNHSDVPAALQEFQLSKLELLFSA